MLVSLSSSRYLLWLFLILLYLLCKSIVDLQSLESHWGIKSTSTLNRHHQPVVAINNNDHDDNNQNNRRDSSWNNIKIAYVITITQCPKGFPTTEGANDTTMATTTTNKLLMGILDYPLILAYSIRLLKTKYPNYKLIALVHPNARSCTRHLKGFFDEVQIKPEPVTMDQIPNDYKSLVVREGCCGILEFMKLYVYNMTDYDVAISLDTDIMFLKPIDELFDAIVMTTKSTNHDYINNDPIQIKTIQNKTLLVYPNNDNNVEPIEFLFTRDYNQRSRHTMDRSKWAVQGGFFVVRPDANVFHQMLSVIRQGSYGGFLGWGQKQYGGYYGAAQIQGFLSYFYGEIRKRKQTNASTTTTNDNTTVTANAIELDPCQYNTLQIWEPTLRVHKKFEQDANKIVCRDGSTIVKGNNKSDNTTTSSPGITCVTDCIKTRLSETKFTHFTTCFKPHYCSYRPHRPVRRFCLEANEAWFRLRQRFEVSLGIVPPPDNVNVTFRNWTTNIFRGYCTKQGEKGYIPMKWKDILKYSNNNMMSKKNVSRQVS